LDTTNMSMYPHTREVEMQCNYLKMRLVLLHKEFKRSIYTVVV
jgi:hypothetical protein